MLPTSPTPQSIMKSTLSELLPLKVISIIDNYLASSHPAQALIMGPDGKPADSEANRPVIASIKLALTSSECDRGIIRAIFKNAIDNGYTVFLNDLMDELRQNNQPINLDNVDFSGLDLSNLNFDAASLKNANFTGCNLSEATFFGSDLTSVRGLHAATGQIGINADTVLARSGLFDAQEKLKGILGQTEYGIALSESHYRSGCSCMVLGGGSTRYLIPISLTNFSFKKQPT